MRRNSRRRLVIFFLALPLLSAGTIAARYLYTSRPGYGLPYSARFMPDVEDRWTALGGTWDVSDGSMRNDSNDRGAKLLTGSPNWKNYIIEGDVQLLGAGSAGVLARVNEAEIGENSFKGYYVGVRTVDNSLVLGVFDFDYHEASKIILPDTVRAFRWYHVKLKVDGCQISGSASAVGMPELKTNSLNDPDCLHSGTAGLRSNGTGGVWRNVTVNPIDRASTSATARALPLPEPDAFRNSDEPASMLPAQPVISLQYMAPFGSPVATIRGSVVLTRPAVYVQDSTAGVEVQSDGKTPLKIGDEVEVTGEVDLDKSSPVIRKAQLRLLREVVPVSPAALTANLVTNGNYDGRFVQVEGYLRAVSVGSDSAVTMDFDAGSQSFHAILPPGRSRSHLQHLALGSRLRLRGVSVVDPKFNRTADPFVLLVRSVEDVDVIAGPPWWRPSTLILATLVVLGVIFTGYHLYLQVKHWRLRAVAEERERLAHEIHDTLAQSFAGIGFQLQAIRNSVPRGSSALEGQIETAMLMARTSHEEARRNIASLRPPSLGSMGLLPALREFAERMVKNGGVTVETYGDDGGWAVPPRIKDTLYRIGQEAIANSIRHADPRTIRIRLHRTQISLCLSVEDDGEGFVANSDRAGFGLLGMRKRAESIAATLTVRSTPGAGTRVEVRANAGSRFLPGPWMRPRLSAKDI